MSSHLLGGLDLKAIADPQTLVVGLKHHYAGRLDQAAKVYEYLIRTYPDHAEARFLLGTAAFQSQQFAHAESLYLAAAKARPDWMLPPYNLGVVYDAVGRHDAANACYRRALELRPDFTSALVNLGNSLLGRGDLNGAIATWERALGADHDSDSEARLNVSFALLLQGRWAEGWAEYEHRQTVPGHAAANPLPAGIPLWQGEDLTGKTILVQEEQGMGDTIMLMRYDALLRAAGAADVLWRVPLLLCDLLTAFGLACLGDDWALIGCQFDYVIPSYSLPFRFGTTPETVPPQPEFVG